MVDNFDKDLSSAAGSVLEDDESVAFRVWLEGHTREQARIKRARDYYDVFHTRRARLDGRLEDYPPGL
jgi:hypothetical protein